MSLKAEKFNDAHVYVEFLILNFYACISDGWGIQHDNGRSSKNNTTTSTEFEVTGHAAVIGASE